MTPIKQWGLAAYYYASLPLRRRLLAQWSATGQAPACVLFYHRVADRHPNEWTIGTEAFERHLTWLQQHTDVVSLPEIQRRLASGAIHRPTTHITFDDGYADNCETAIPLLIRRAIPCTYFVSLRFVVTGQPFPHDQRTGIPLAPNTITQLRAMAQSGIEIGSHTRNHADLGVIQDGDRLYDEIVAASREIADRVGAPVRYFAFPYGQRANMTEQAVEIARASGLCGICSAYGAYNWPGDDPFHLRRIHGDPQFTRFRNWLTFDPRKLSREPLYAHDAS